MKHLYKTLQDIVMGSFQELSDRILFESHNSYVLYNQYAIVKSGACYTVYRRRDERTFRFNSIKNALTWSILDHNTKLSDAKRLLELDTLTESVKIDINIHTKLKNRSTSDQQMIYINKLQTDKQRQRQFKYELDKYYITADLCHKKKKGTSNERSRTSKK